MSPLAAFDHDAARRLRAEGITFPEIARRLGVGLTSVRAAIYNYDTCECGNTKSKTSPRCIACRKARTIRPNTLWCALCQAWKPDRDFKRSAHRTARRQRHVYCRQCDNDRMRTGTCILCGAPCKSISVRCKTCQTGKLNTTTRPDTLWCNACQTWKPDDAFNRNRIRTTRRGRAPQCRECAVVYARRRRRRLAS